MQRAIDAGLDVDAFAPRLSFFFAAHNDLFEEAAKFRAARRIYARLMRERFQRERRQRAAALSHADGRRDAQAQQPLNNVVRVAVQALSAVLGGTQSLHTNGYDEALALPTEAAATLALRTQQIIAQRVGCGAHGRSAGGKLLRRALTERARATGDRAARARGRAWAGGASDRRLVLSGRDRAQRVRVSAARRERG